MTGHRSIGERLRRAKTPEALTATAEEWARNWQQDQHAVVDALEEAYRARNWDAVRILTAELRAITDKRFTALPRVLAALAAGPDTPSR